MNFHNFHVFRDVFDERMVLAAQKYVPKKEIAPRIRFSWFLSSQTRILCRNAWFLVFRHPSRTSKFHRFSRGSPCLGSWEDAQLIGTSAKWAVRMLPIISHRCGPYSGSYEMKRLHFAPFDALGRISRISKFSSISPSW